MGSVTRKRVTNVLEVPNDVLAQMFGRGLAVNREREPVSVEINTGLGLAFDDKTGALVVDMEVDPERCSTFVMMTDSALLLDGRKLSLKKTYTRFKIHRNYDGYILDIIPFEVFETVDDVIVTDYGYSCPNGKSSREATPESPNFYRK